MKNVFSVMGILLLAPVFAGSIPTVSLDSVSQDASRLVTVDYTVSGGAVIVTADVLTNGCSIGAANFRNMEGDVNVLVRPGAHRITWRPDKIWPGFRFTHGEASFHLKAWAPSEPPTFMVVDLTAAAASERNVKFYASEGAIPESLDADVYKTDKMVFKRVECAGISWRMGSPGVTEEFGRAADEGLRYVTLSNDFYMGVYEVTQRQWELLMGDRPSTFKNPDCYAKRPVETVSYNRIRGTDYTWPEDGHRVSTGFMATLRTLCGGAFAFDLPTEAQWEYACRAGRTSPLINGWTMSSQYYSAALQSSNCRCAPNATSGGKSPPDTATAGLDDGTNEVGLATPNDWGFCDMAGNVGEWCLDWYENNPIQDMSTVDPETGAATADVTRTYRVNRGGSWYGRVSYVRISRRSGTKPEDKSASGQTGFRVLCPIGIAP